ncbi:MAG: T9SS type A sorting domain-containing protein [Ferruginibacter sp.]
MVKLVPYVAGGSAPLKQLTVLDEKSLDVVIYPNPTTTYFNLQIKSADKSNEVRLRVLDVQGRVIKTMLAASQSQINIGSELKPGVYMLEAIQGDVRKISRMVKY